MPQIVTGSYTSDGAARTINLVMDPDEFEVYIQGSAAGDNWDSVANPGVTKRAWWFRGMTNATALTVRNTDGLATDQSDFLAAGGFTLFDGSVQTPGATITGTAINQASPAQVTINGHGLATGDRVTLFNCTGMRQVEGMVFSVTVTGANTFTIPINTAGFAAAATAVSARRLPAVPLFSPRRHFITGITAANPGVVTVSENHSYTVGDTVTFSIPRVTAAAFGMTQLDGLTAEITVVTATTFTTDINTSAFTAFAFPATASVPFTHAQVMPVGEIATVVDNPEANDGIRGLTLGTSVCGPNGALVFWKAIKSDQVQ